MKENDYKPHFQKSSLAALNYLNKVYGLPNIANFSHLWPKVHAVLGRWDDHLKKNPYHAQSAGHFTTEALNQILQLRCQNTGELLDLVIVVTTCWSSLRTCDLISLLSKNVSLLPMDRKVPRRVKLYLESTKNDPQGIGLASTREFFVPCVCLEKLNSDEVKKFRNRVRLNPTTACATSCPYEIIQRYLTQIEDPYGQIAVASNSTPPRYLRARNPNSSVHNFLLRPLGNHTT